jgi:hypothetical protein
MTSAPNGGVVAAGIDRCHAHPPEPAIVLAFDSHEALDGISGFANK